jgi:hypothetical protein
MTARALRFSSARLGVIARWRIIVAAGALVACAASTDVAAGRETASTVGIGRLSAEAYDEAIACGRSGAECAITPYLLCPASNERFSSYLATPFSRVASGVAEATRTGERIEPMSPGEANGWGVGIFVTPGPNPRLSESIHRVMIKRGGKVIEPTTTTLAPAVYRGRGSPPLSKGYFAFPMDAFSLTSELTVVFVGASGEFTCALDQRKLSSLR